MSYDPKDHVFTAKQIIAGWIMCVGVVSLGIGLTARHVPDPMIAPAAYAATTMSVQPCGRRLPRFPLCRSKPSFDIAQGYQGVTTLPAGSCG